MKRSPLNPISRKRAKGLIFYSKVRKQYLSDHPQCEICSSRNATEIHHQMGRLGDFLFNTHHFLACCRECHQWIHDHPKLAILNGFTKLRNL